MAAKQPRLGVDHVTVVPTNFEPPEEFAAAAAEDGDEETTE
ncbi:hypothetical protein [Haloprofundus halobius]|nr:hypothetical protein [Haloprofundus halobius]